MINKNYHKNINKIHKILFYGTIYYYTHNILLYIIY